MHLQVPVFGSILPLLSQHRIAAAMVREMRK
jgi:hypothetical protein